MPVNERFVQTTAAHAVAARQMHSQTYSNTMYCRKWYVISHPMVKSCTNPMQPIYRHNNAPGTWRSLYSPSPGPHKSGYLQVSPIHRIYYEVHGNEQGRPAVFLHGGPGAGCFNNHAYVLLVPHVCCHVCLCFPHKT